MGIREIIGPITKQAGTRLEEELGQKVHGVLIFLADDDVEMAVGLYHLDSSTTIGLLERILDFLKEKNSGQEG